MGQVVTTGGKICKCKWIMVFELYHQMWNWMVWSKIQLSIPSWNIRSVRQALCNSGLYLVCTSLRLYIFMLSFSQGGLISAMLIPDKPNGKGTFPKGVSAQLLWMKPVDLSSCPGCIKNIMNCSSELFIIHACIHWALQATVAHIRKIYMDAPSHHRLI